VLSKKPDGVLGPEKQYAVVLLNEDQVQQLMGGRPPARQINRGYSVRDVHSRFLRLKRQTTAVAITLLALGAGAFVWFMVPQPAVASIFAWKETADAPVLPTGASFSVTVASLDSSDAAGSAATRVRSLGLPVFTRLSPDRNQLHQAMVGPYASLDEAERVQRRLSRAGMSGARIFVDESLRNVPRSEAPQGIPDSNPSVLLIGAPDRVTLVVEMPSEPRQVRSRRSDGLMDLDVGPMPNPVYAQQWVAPEAVHLVERVAIESAPPSENGQFLRAHIALPEFAHANVRSEGKRVYVDLTWPLAQQPDKADPQPSARFATAERPEPAASPRPAPSALTPATSAPTHATSAPMPAAGAPMPAPPASPAASPANARADQQYAQAIRPIVDRLTEIKPFLLSASQSGSPEVLKALDDTLSTLDASLKGLRPPASAADQHQMLTEVLRTARRALSPAFTGDRQAQAHQAVGMFEASTVAVTPTN
jgi:SPOR domain